MKYLLTMFICCLAGFVSAQVTLGPEEVADAAVQDWLERAESFDYFSLAGTSPETVCTELTALGQDPRLISSAKINFEDRRALEQTTEEIRSYVYPASLSSSTVGRVRVDLARSEGSWVAQRVQLQFDTPNVGLPGFMRNPLAGWVFIVLTGLFIWWLSRPGLLRRWLAEGWGYINQHRVIVAGTLIALYGMYALGSLFGTQLPACQETIATFLSGGLSQTGIVEVLQTGSIAHVAGVITYWNFSQGALLTSFLPASIFAVPAYLINLSRYFALGVALAPVGSEAWLLLFHIPVIVIELMAYALVTAGGGMFLASLFRQGFAGYGSGLRKLLMMLPIALLLLLIGAWYESFEILWLIPQLQGL